MDSWKYFSAGPSHFTTLSLLFLYPPGILNGLSSFPLLLYAFVPSGLKTVGAPASIREPSGLNTVGGLGSAHAPATRAKIAKRTYMTTILQTLSLPTQDIHNISNILIQRGLTLQPAYAAGVCVSLENLPPTDARATKSR